MSKSNPDALAALSSRSTETEAQVQRVLAMLKATKPTTHSLRSAGVSHPAARIMDLRKRGYVIDTNRVTTVDSDGYTHVRSALYVLISGPDVKAQMELIEQEADTAPRRELSAPLAEASSARAPLEYQDGP